MNESPRVAIVGCGRMGKQHAATCQRLGATVRIVCDPDGERARALAADLADARVIANSDAIDWSDVDAAFFCTPPFARGAAECAAARAGVAIFLEKPVSLDHVVGRQILEAACAGKSLTAVGYMNRYRPAVRRARELAGELGLLGLACHWVGGIYRVPWWGQRQLSGGQINEQCTHYFDLVRFFCGEIAEVAALGQPAPQTTGVDIDIATAVVCRARSGALATLYASCGADAKQIGFQFFTRARQISLDGWDLELRAPDSAASIDPFLAEVEAFLTALRTGNRELIASDLADALETQLAVDAAVRALASGRTEPVACQSDMTVPAQRAPTPH